MILSSSRQIAHCEHASPETLISVAWTMAARWRNAAAFAAALSLLIPGALAEGQQRLEDMPAGRYTADLKHTHVYFSYDHVGFSHAHGRFDHVEGHLEFLPLALNRSTATVEIDS